MSDIDLKAGARGPNVSELQAKLQKLGMPVESDGIFGPKTRAAIEDLQAMFGYDVDGIVGKATRMLIDTQLGYGFRGDAPDAVKRGLEAQGKKSADGQLLGSTLVRTLKRGSEGVDVRYLQRRLLALGFSLTVDGKFGEATEQAVRSLQTSFGYDVDGIVGAQTTKLIDAQIGYGFRADTASVKA